MRIVLGRMAVVLVVVFAFGGIAACGGDDSDEGSSDSGADSAAGPTEEPAKKPDALTVRSWADSFMEQPGSCAETFTEKTGIPVKVDTTDEGPSQAKVTQAIRAGERPPVDVSYQLQTYGYLNGLQGLNVPISPEVAPNLELVNQGAAKPPDLPDEDGWQYVNLGAINVVVIYDTERWKESDFQSYEDLWDPKFKGEIFLDGAFASTSYLFAKTFGIDPADGPPESLDPLWEKFEELRPNLAGVGAPSDGAKVISSGQASVAVSIAALRNDVNEAGAKFEYTTPKEGVFLFGDAMYIHDGIPEESKYYAQVFVNECLEASVQAAVAEGGTIPVNPDAELPDFMVENPQVWPVTEEQAEEVAVRPDMRLLAENQDAWQGSFEEAVR